MTLPAQDAGSVTIAGRQIPRIGFGLGSLARSAEKGRQEFDAGVALLHHALDAGIQFYDTAEFYENGTANRALAAAFAGRRDEVFYASKVGARPLENGPVPMTAAQRPAELRDAVEQNLKNLRTDHLDLVYMRRMDMLPGLVIADGDEQKVDLDDQLAELSTLRDEGKVGAIGLSHVTLEQVQQALPVGIAAVSNIHSMLDRTHEQLLRLCEQHDIVWSPYFPLGGGFAKLPKVVEVPLVRDGAQQLGVTPQQLGLAWLLQHSPLSLVISGTASIAHLDENIAAAAVRIPADLMQQLDAVA